MTADAEPPDAPPGPGFRVGGTVLGLRAPITMQLGGTQTRTITEDGPFNFRTPVDNGTYSVGVDTPTCIVTPTSVMVDNGNVSNVEVLCDGVVELRDVSFSMPVVLSPAYDPRHATYAGARRLLAPPTFTVSPTAAYASATMTVATVPTPSGGLSPPFPNDVASVPIVVSHPPYPDRSYTFGLTAALTQEAYVKASNTDGGTAGVPGDVFGAGTGFGLSTSLLGVAHTAVALSGDTLIVGAPLEDSAATVINGNQASNTAQDAGAAYVFRRAGTIWVQEAYLKASNTAPGDQFGASVAIDGDRIVVGAAGQDGGGAAAGAAYVFHRTGTTWEQIGLLTAGNGGPGDNFGVAVAISGDVIIIGAPGEDSMANDSGAAYVFRWNGTAWAQEAFVKASNAGASDGFGVAVAIAGGTAAVGAPFEDSNTMGVGTVGNEAAADAGAVYVYGLPPAWPQQAYIKADDTGAGDWFGKALALDGDTLAVGAPEAEAVGRTDTGAVYVLFRNVTWSHQSGALRPGAVDNLDELGSAVALDGDHLVCGSPNESSGATGVGGSETDNSRFGAGAAYVYVRKGAAWTKEAFVKASNTDDNDQFGSAVAVDRDTMAAGAFFEDSSATGIDMGQGNMTLNFNAGAVYVFR